MQIHFYYYDYNIFGKEGHEMAVTSTDMRTY